MPWISAWRWLLIAHDRAKGDTFPMTQELLAMMLCVHRPGVTVAARLFQQAGLIRSATARLRLRTAPAWKRQRVSVTAWSPANSSVCWVLSGTRLVYLNL